MTVTADIPALPSAPGDRRRSARFKLAEPFTAIVGRGTATLVDISATGARIRHTYPLARASEVRVKFDWKGERFEATAEVLASRVVGIGENGTVFETRLRFIRITRDASAVLERTITDLGDGNMRKWVANLRGWSHEEPAAPPAPAQPRTVNTFVRCRYINNSRWEHRITRDPSIPADGFTVAEGTELSEIRALCRTFEQSDAEGRRLLQLLSSAVLNG